jgi:hypothetical protein
VLHEHGEPWLGDIDRKKHLIRLPELSGNLTNSHLVGKLEELTKKIMNLAYEYLIRISKGFLTCHKILRHGVFGFTSPPKEGVLRIFIALKNHRLRPG